MLSTQHCFNKAFRKPVPCVFLSWQTQCLLQNSTAPASGWRVFCWLLFPPTPVSHAGGSCPCCSLGPGHCSPLPFFALTELRFLSAAAAAAAAEPKHVTRPLISSSPMVGQRREVLRIFTSISQVKPPLSNSSQSIPEAKPILLYFQERL